MPFISHTNTTFRAMDSITELVLIRLHKRMPLALDVFHNGPSLYQLIGQLPTPKIEILNLSRSPIRYGWFGCKASWNEPKTSQSACLALIDKVSVSLDKLAFHPPESANFLDNSVVNIFLAYLWYMIVFINPDKKIYNVEATRSVFRMDLQPTLLREICHNRERSISLLGWSACICLHIAHIPAWWL